MQFLPAPKRAIADYMPLVMADAVWGGGGFGTRLNLNLREDKGYSYGVFSNLVLMREAGIWYAAGPVQTDKTSESVAEFDKEMKAHRRRQGRSPRTSSPRPSRPRSRGFAQSSSRTRASATRSSGCGPLGLPMSELQGEYDEAAKATLPAALAAAKLHARPDRASMILVGDRAKIEGKVRATQGRRHRRRRRRRPARGRRRAPASPSSSAR